MARRPHPVAWRLEAFAARTAIRILRRLGPARASNWGGRLMRLIGPLLPVSRVAEANLRLALPELDAAARNRVVRAVWDNLGRTVGELPHVNALRETASGPGWEIEGAEHLRALAQQGGPAIFVSGHLGNWEMLPLVLARHGIPMASLYRAPDNPHIDRLLRKLRARGAGATTRLLPKGAVGARASLQLLNGGGFLGMLIDQKMNDGIAVEFFGHQAMTAPAMAALALRYRCPVIMGRVQRLGPARFRVIVGPFLPLVDSGDRLADIAAVTQAATHQLEDWIRDRPGDWLWLHRRWPR